MSTIPTDVVSQQQGAVFRRLCQQGNAQLVVELLRSSNIAIDHAQSDGCTGLWLAAEQGCSEVVKLLCGFQANVSVAKQPGAVTPLYVAAQNGHEAVVAALLAAGAYPNAAKSTGATPLYIACQQNFSGIARLLLRSGAAANSANAQGITPLMIAAFQGSGECVTLLLEAGADPMQQGQEKNCLDWAQTNGHRRAVQNLLEAHRAKGQRALMESSALSALAGNTTAGAVPPQQASATGGPGPSSSSLLRAAGGGGAGPLFPASALLDDGYASINKTQPGGLHASAGASWYTPQFLLRPSATAGGSNGSTSRSVGAGAPAPPPGVGLQPTMSSEAIERYVAKKQRVVSAMTAGAAGFQSGGGVTVAMIDEERRRNEDFRKSISRSVTIGAKDGNDGGGSSRSLLGSGQPVTDEAVVFRVEQGWAAHKQHLVAHEAFLRETASEVSDAWMYSGQMIQQYQDSVATKRQQFRQSHDKNRQLYEQNESNKKKNPYLYPALPEAKLILLTDFMLKGAGASGPPPPLPSEEEAEKLTQPDKYAPADEPGSPLAAGSFRR